MLSDVMDAGADVRTTLRAALADALDGDTALPRFSKALGSVVVATSRRRGQIRQRVCVAGETLAMALAENGQFERAVRVQRDVMAANQQAGVLDVNGALNANLKRYESRQPCRTPWPPE